MLMKLTAGSFFAFGIFERKKMFVKLAAAADNFEWEYFEKKLFKNGDF